MSDASASPRSLGASLDATGTSSLEAAYRDHSDVVFALALRLLRDRTLAEDVTQEVFLRLWRRPERFDPARGALRTFLLSDCHGRAVDSIRNESARRQREERNGRSNVPDGSSDLATYVCDAETHRRVAGLVQHLPPLEREAIVLAFSAEITYRQVAAALGVAEGTVKTRIRSGLSRLRRQMLGLDIEAA